MRWPGLVSERDECDGAKALGRLLFKTLDLTLSGFRELIWLMRPADLRVSAESEPCARRSSVPLIYAARRSNKRRTADNKQRATYKDIVLCSH